jgi:hypothetical protein
VTEALWWLVFRADEGPFVVIQRGASLIHARMAAAIAGFETGPFSEGHQLDGKTIRKIPKSLIGKPLSQRQARQLLSKIIR